jgi:hypothetical protein
MAKLASPMLTTEQFRIVHENIPRVALLAVGISSDIAPPLQFDGTPLAPLATLTVQLIKVEERNVTFEKATLLRYTAPPPPVAVPGRTAVEFVRAEHAMKLELKASKVKLNPTKLGAIVEAITPATNSTNWSV